MATWAIRPIHPAYRRDGDVFKNYPLAAAQTFKKGAAVLRDGSGDFAEAGADPAAIAGFATAGAAEYDWKTDTFGNVVPSVPVALADQEFRGTLLGTFSEAADLNAEFGLVLDGSGYWVVDRSETVNTRVRITGVDDEVADGDVNPPVRFVVLTANRQVIS